MTKSAAPELTRIDVLQNIKHGGQVYHAGEVRLVSPEDAAYFCTHGWAKSDSLVSGTPDTSPKTLDVQNGKHGHAAQNPGVK